MPCRFVSSNCSCLWITSTTGCGWKYDQVTVFIRSHIHPPTHPLLLPPPSFFLTHSIPLNHSHTQSLTQLITRSLLHPLIQPVILQLSQNPPNHSLIHPHTHTMFHSLLISHSLVQLSTHSLTHSATHTLTRQCVIMLLCFCKDCCEPVPGESSDVGHIRYDPRGLPPGAPPSDGMWVIHYMLTSSLRINAQLR